MSNRVGYIISSSIFIGCFIKMTDIECECDCGCADDICECDDCECEHADLE